MVTDEPTVVRFLLIGAGNVGRRFLELLLAKEEYLRARQGLEFRLVGIADSSGIAVRPDGLDLQQIIGLKASRRGVAEAPQWGRPEVAALEMIQTSPADLVLDASPANYLDGQPGLSCIEAALERGAHVVTANKAPLVLAYPRLVALARQQGVQLQFDATVAGGLPVINLGRRDLGFARITRLEGILNLTANYVLARMAEQRSSYDQALAEARQAGHAEADPALDVEGNDSGAKLVILACSVLGQLATMRDVSITGIKGISQADLQRATAEGKRIKLLAVAEWLGERYDLRVGPVWLDADHPLAHLTGEQMGVVFYTDVSGIIAASIVETTPLPTAAAMLRDVLLIYGKYC